MYTLKDSYWENDNFILKIHIEDGINKTYNITCIKTSNGDVQLYTINGGVDVLLNHETPLGSYALYCYKNNFK